VWVFTISLPVIPVEQSEEPKFRTGFNTGLCVKNEMLIGFLFLEASAVGGGHSLRNILERINDKQIIIPCFDRCRFLWLWQKVSN
jgi:hypothetical protein